MTMDDKDRMRIADIIRKSDGDVMKARHLAHTMALAITDIDKAWRRSYAARNQRRADLAEIFQQRAEQLIQIRRVRARMEGAV